MMTMFNRQSPLFNPARPNNHRTPPRSSSPRSLLCPCSPYCAHTHSTATAHTHNYRQKNASTISATNTTHTTVQFFTLLRTNNIRPDNAHSAGTCRRMYRRLFRTLRQHVSLASSDRREAQLFTCVVPRTCRSPHQSRHLCQGQRPYTACAPHLRRYPTHRSLARCLPPAHPQRSADHSLPPARACLPSASRFTTQLHHYTQCPPNDSALFLAHFLRTVYYVECLSARV